MDFLSLSIDERGEYICEKGMFLCSANHYEYLVCLYVAEGKFYELWYNDSTELLEDVCPLAKSKLFREYIKQN